MLAQSAASPERLQFVDEHLQAEAETSSVRVMTNITRRRCQAFLWVLVPCTYLLT